MVDSPSWIQHPLLTLGLLVGTGVAFVITYLSILTPKSLEKALERRRRLVTVETIGKSASKLAAAVVTAPLVAGYTLVILTGESSRVWPFLVQCAVGAVAFWKRLDEVGRAIAIAQTESPNG